MYYIYCSNQNKLALANPNRSWTNRLRDWHRQKHLKNTGLILFYNVLYMYRLYSIGIKNQYGKMLDGQPWCKIASSYDSRKRSHRKPTIQCGMSMDAHLFPIDGHVHGRLCFGDLWCSPATPRIVGKWAPWSNDPACCRGPCGKPLGFKENSWKNSPEF